MELCAECGVPLDKIRNSPDEYGRVFKKLGDELASAYENTFDADTIIRQNCNEMA